MKANTRYCPCGAKLWSRAELLASDDPIMRYVGEAYIDDESGYCLDEDDVVPYERLDRVFPEDRS